MARFTRGRNGTGFAARTRAPKKGAWSGFVDSYSPSFSAGTQIHSTIIWDPSTSSDMNVPGTLSIRRIVGDVCIKTSTSGPNPLIGCYLMIFPTDAVEDVPADLVFNPLDISANILEKRTLWNELFYVEQQNTNDPGLMNMHIDISPRGHRMSNEDTLLFVLCGNGGFATGNVVNVKLRAYAQY